MIGINVICASVGIFIFFSVFPAHARPQVQDVEETGALFPADGFVFDGPADRGNPFQRPNRRTTQRPATFPTPTPQILQTTPEFTTASPLTTTASPEYIACTRNCQTTPEYNPLCGSDMVVYNNPGRLSCAISCGRNVTMLYYGKCTSTIRG